VPGFAKVLKEGRSHFQIGNNTNLFDWTYVGNVAHAHILAADKLIARPPSTPEEVAETFETALPPLDLTTGRHRVPTSCARPLGPYVERPARGDEISSAFEGPHNPERPVIRSRFDQLSDPSLKRSAADPLQVAGQVFFITNGEPIYFWDFPRRLWRMLAPIHIPLAIPSCCPRLSVSRSQPCPSGLVGCQDGSRPSPASESPTPAHTGGTTLKRPVGYWVTNLRLASRMLCEEQPRYAQICFTRLSHADA
jgi:hypothetical protein